MLGFVIVGSVRGSSEGFGGVGWGKGREAKQRLGSRENNEENKNQKQGKKRGGGGQEADRREKAEKAERVRGKVEKRHTCYINQIFFFNILLAVVCFFFLIWC